MGTVVPIGMGIRGTLKNQAIVLAVVLCGVTFSQTDTFAAFGSRVSLKLLLEGPWAALVFHFSNR
jgi:hypothetical protein